MHDVGRLPKGASQNAKYMRFGASFRLISLYTLPSLPTLFLYLTLIPFHPYPPLPQRGEQET